jgi:hypothetical protein
MHRAWAVLRALTWINARSSEAALPGDFERRTTSHEAARPGHRREYPREVERSGTVQAATCQNPDSGAAG